MHHACLPSPKENWILINNFWVKKTEPFYYLLPFLSQHMIIASIVLDFRQDLKQRKYVLIFWVLNFENEFFAKKRWVAIIILVVILLYSEKLTIAVSDLYRYKVNLMTGVWCLNRRKFLTRTKCSTRRDLGAARGNQQLALIKINLCNWKITRTANISEFFNSHWLY